MYVHRAHVYVIKYAHRHILNFHVTSNMQEAKQTLDDFQGSLDTVKKKMTSAAEYFCQDASKFKLEELLKEILTFVNDYENAQKVDHNAVCVCVCAMKHYIY